MKMTELMNLLETDKLPSSFEAVAGNGGGANDDKAGIKRKREGGGEAELDLLGGVVPPANDIYRARQQKRVHVA